MTENPFTPILEQLNRLENLIRQGQAGSVVEGPNWLNVDELCTYLPERPAKSTIYAWVHQRAIPFHKHSKKLYFLKSEIDQWMLSSAKGNATSIHIPARRIQKGGQRHES
jgi:excisionase family DNA binding protein